MKVLRALSPVVGLLDLFIVLGTLAAAQELRAHIDLGVSLGPDERSWLSWQLFLVAVPIWAASFFFFGAHEPRRVATGTTIGRTLLSNLMGTLLFVSFFFFFKVVDFSRLLIGYFFVMSSTLLVARQVILRLVMRRKNALSRRMLLIGEGELGVEALDRISSIPWGFELLGVVAYDAQLSARAEELGITLYPREAQAEALVSRLGADDVLIALPSERHLELTDLIGDLDATAVRIHLVPDIMEFAFVRATVSDFLGLPVIGLRDPPHDQLGRTVKRALDFLGSLALIVALSPLLLLTAFAIKLSDGGPVLFRQRRVGENGREFEMLKFRSMVVNAEAQLLALGVDRGNLPAENPVFKLENDPRVTGLGQIMRRTSIDELPQLFNVLWGDMSLVGPRPEEAAVVECYSRFHRKRLTVKPGITGPMQVSGRGDLSMKQRVSVELAYIESWTLWSDLKILAKTIPVVLLGKGAR